MHTAENPRSAEQHVGETTTSYKKKIKRAVTTFLAAGVLLWGVKTNFDPKRGTAKPTFQEFLEETVVKRDNLNRQEATSLHQNLTFLSEQFSPHIITHLSNAEHRGRTESDNFPPEPSLIVESPESQLIKASQIAELWSEENFPIGSIEGKLSRIEVVSEVSAKPVEYGHASEHVAGLTTKESNQIHISLRDDPLVPMENNLVGVDWVFSHELGHINDWEHDPTLTLTERAAFLAEVTRAFSQAGSFRDPAGYIHGIKNKDSNVEHYLKVSEYWAELTRYYFSFPAAFKKIASPLEIALVERHYKKTDPLFDPEKAQKRRLEIIQKIVGSGDKP